MQLLQARSQAAACRAPSRSRSALVVRSSLGESSRVQLAASVAAAAFVLAPPAFASLPPGVESPQGSQAIELESKLDALIEARTGKADALPELTSSPTTPLEAPKKEAPKLPLVAAPMAPAVAEPPAPAAPVAAKRVVEAPSKGLQASQAAAPAVEGGSNSGLLIGGGVALVGAVAAAALAGNNNAAEQQPAASAPAAAAAPTAPDAATPVAAEGAAPAEPSSPATE